MSSPANIVLLILDHFITHNQPEKAAGYQTDLNVFVQLVAVTVWSPEFFQQ